MNFLDFARAVLGRGVEGLGQLHLLVQQGADAGIVGRGPRRGHDDGRQEQRQGHQHGIGRRLLQAERGMRRLKVVETLVLDPARRLVLVQIDDEERLLLLGEGKELERPDSQP